MSLRLKSRQPLYGAREIPESYIGRQVLVIPKKNEIWMDCQHRLQIMLTIPEDNMGHWEFFLNSIQPFRFRLLRSPAFNPLNRTVPRNNHMQLSAIQAFT